MFSTFQNTTSHLFWYELNKLCYSTLEYHRQLYTRRFDFRQTLSIHISTKETRPQTDTLLSPMIEYPSDNQNYLSRSSCLKQVMKLMNYGVRNSWGIVSEGSRKILGKFKPAVGVGLRYFLPAAAGKSQYLYPYSPEDLSPWWPDTLIIIHNKYYQGNDCLVPLYIYGRPSSHRSLEIISLYCPHTILPLLSPYYHKSKH